MDENPKQEMPIPLLEGTDPALGEEAIVSEEYQAKQLAERLGLEYVDLGDFEIDPELFRHIPVDLMFRYNFVPRQRGEDGALRIVVSDPTDVLMLDELELLLGESLDLCVGTQTSIVTDGRAAGRSDCSVP